MKVLCLWYASEEEKRFIQSKLPEGTEVIAPVFYGALYCVRNVASIIKEMLG
ncbi:hypothetical protein [Pseudomonas putida]|uniref:hypothetical protein n=1 Tax=Pseudomonas putida TaxID=303 RepID=UPI001CD6A040|nr:hypothetical protein [Pseudomonas putida]